MKAHSRSTDQPRIDSRRLFSVLMISAVLPMSLLILLDIYTGFLPVLTIVGLLVFLPAGSFFVSRAALAEFDKIIEDVAPSGAEPLAAPLPDDQEAGLPPLAPTP